MSLDVAREGMFNMPVAHRLYLVQSCWPLAIVARAIQISLSRLHWRMKKRVIRVPKACSFYLSLSLSGSILQADDEEDSLTNERFYGFSFSHHWILLEAKSDRGIEIAVTTREAMSRYTLCLRFAVGVADATV